MIDTNERLRIVFDMACDVADALREDRREEALKNLRWAVNLMRATETK